MPFFQEACCLRSCQSQAASLGVLECFSCGGKRSISRVCCWQREEGPRSHSEPSCSSRVPGSPRSFAFPAKKMCSCCYGESLAVSVPGANCSKSVLVSALSSAFYFAVPGQSLWSANKDVRQPLCCWTQVLGSTLPPSKLPARVFYRMSLLDMGGSPQPSLKCSVFFILRGSICLFQKIWKI